MSDKKSIFKFGDKFGVESPLRKPLVRRENNESQDSRPKNTQANIARISERPNPQTSSLNYNFLFFQDPSSNLTAQQFNAFIVGFQQNILNIWGTQTFNGTRVQITGQFAPIFNFNALPPPPPGFTNVPVRVGNTTIVSFARNGQITMNENDYNIQSGLFPNNSPSHEFGHVMGLSDRYVDGGIFIPVAYILNPGGFRLPAGGQFVDEKDDDTTIIQTNSPNETIYFRETVPIWHPVDVADPNYDPFNNLYSTGQPILTPYQLCVAFNIYRNEPRWNRGFLWFARGLRAISDTPFTTSGVLRASYPNTNFNRMIPKFDAFNILLDSPFLVPPSALQQQDNLQPRLGCQGLLNGNYPFLAPNNTMLFRDGTITDNNDTNSTTQCGETIQLVRRDPQGNQNHQVLTLDRTKSIVSRNLNFFTTKKSKELLFLKGNDKRFVRKNKTMYKKMYEVLENDH